MNRKLAWCILGLCFIVSVVINSLYPAPLRMRLILVGSVVISYGVWFYDIYKGNQAQEEELLYDVYLVCPVKYATDEELEKIRKYVEQLESVGYKIYWPYRDTNQEDEIGLRISEDNCDAMMQSKEIHVWYSILSLGSIFDFGMAFTTDRPIILANPEAVTSTEGTSFPNMLLELHRPYIDHNQRPT